MCQLRNLPSVDRPVPRAIDNEIFRQDDYVSSVQDNNVATRLDRVLRPGSSIASPNLAYADEVGIDKTEW